MGSRRTFFKVFVFSLLALLIPSSTEAKKADKLTAREFSFLIESLSEPEGTFNFDNFVSNESSFQQVLGKLKELKIEGGTYIGVGPEQNLTYIAHLRPSIAFIVDIRRQNLLEHLIFKAIFDFAETRQEFLSILFSKPLKAETAKEQSPSIERLIEYFEAAPSDQASLQANLMRLRKKIEKEYRVKLSASDLERIRYIYGAFYRENLDIRSFRRPYIPTLRDLLLETDLKGEHRHFLASDEDYGFLREMHRRHLIIPLVGDFGGFHAFAALGRYLKERRETVSVFYVSNVEPYLLRDGKWDQYVSNIRRLPFSNKSLFIRAYFDYLYPHPEQDPRHAMATLLQRIETFLKCESQSCYLSYRDMATRDYIPLYEPAAVSASQ
ncbi:MAG: hypothetical protein HY645_11545 [Acidobacteria bacterium]|nr:hypothetical protein [Acidobacteriota bacterium]